MLKRNKINIGERKFYTVYKIFTNLEKEFQDMMLKTDDRFKS